MAVKNHALDQKIVEAARAEFLEKGFRGASLQQIAARAGLTTGALYTRYRGKDDLFASLIQEVLTDAADLSGQLETQYRAAGERRNPDAILAAIRAEEEAYQELLLRHPQACTLLLCRSDGSALEAQLRQLMAQKAASTADYLRTLARTDQVDLDGVQALMSAQFLCYRQLLEQGYSPEKTLACLRTVGIYMEAGWRALFEAIL